MSGRPVQAGLGQPEQGRLLLVAGRGKLQVMVEVNMDIEQARDTLAQLEDMTWAVTLRDRWGAVRGAAGRGIELSALDSARRPAMKLSSR